MMPVSMVGRTGELDELTRAWWDVADRRTAGPRTVVVTGGAGIGKSMLVATALTGLNPAIVLAGTARVHAPAPYDWLAAVLDGRDTSRLSVPAAPLAWLAQHPDAQRERYAPGALLRMAVRTVRELVDVGPAVILVEDLHGLDPASLNLVAELGAGSGLPALLLVTSQPPEVALSPQLAARTLARLSSTPGAVRQHLSPLAPAEVAQVLAQVYPDAPVPNPVVQRVWKRTRGNPYVLRELLATSGAVVPTALGRRPLPGHLRLGPAPEPTRQALAPEPMGARQALAPVASRADVVGVDLTAREREVLGCLAQGMSNKGIARSLGISIRTVTVHVSNLLRKTRSQSRTEAAVWAVQNAPTAPADGVA
jgi:DNA-binding CsgD family transcriptional regulator